MFDAEWSLVTRFRRSFLLVLVALLAADRVHVVLQLDRDVLGLRADELRREDLLLVVPITIPDRRELEERARKELRSLSGYVARLVVEDLARVLAGC